MTFDSELQKHVYRELIKYAAGHGECAYCHVEYGDASETVLLTDTADRTVQLCARCYGRPVGCFTAGAVTVIDGRELFARKTPRKHARVWYWAF